MEYIQKEQIDTLLCDSCHINIASKVLWESKYIKRYILKDTDDALFIESYNQKIQSKMWDVIAIQSDDNQIAQTGWNSSFTGRLFTEQEMHEYVDNAYNKLKPFLNTAISVLEIGIASGLTCCAVAPDVRNYIGIDISKETLKKTEKTLLKKGIKNVSLICAEALKIDTLEIMNQDIVIINSVAQYFPGYNYFVILLKKLLCCLKEQAVIFVGDILDMDKKDILKSDLQKAGKNKSNKNDLYYSRDFMRELPAYIPEIYNVEISDKTGYVDNELKKYRYDILIQIDKTNKRKVAHTKYQYAMKDKNFTISQIYNEN